MVASQSFTNVVDAQAYFSGGMVDLGAFAQTGAVHVSLSLAVATSAVGDGFGESFLLGTTSTTSGNSAPVIIPPAPTSAVEDGVTVSIDALAGASDPDAFAVLSVVGVQPTLPAGVTYNSATHRFSLNPTNAAYQSLAAGEVKLVSVGYGVTDGLATTAATAVFAVTGVNDAPIVAGPQTFQTAEDFLPLAFNPLLRATDVDTSDVLSVVPDVLPSWIHKTAAGYIFDPADAAFQSLSVGESTTVTWNYAVTDGHVSVPTFARFTVFGQNDAPVVSSPVNGGTVLESAAPVILNLLANATDVDHLDTVSINSSFGTTASVSSGTWNAPILFSVANGQLTIDPGQFAALSVGKMLGLTFNYSVTDGHGGGAAASANLTVQGLNTGPGLTLTEASATATLAKIQGGSGLVGKTVMATIGTINGPPGDAYTYTLGGTGAVAFTLATAGSGATLSTGNNAPVGAAGGQLYGLTVTARDTTTGTTSGVVATDVVVGLGKGTNTINLASLPSMTASAPAFIYDLGGSDTINGAGMTGPLFITGGAGADTMTGGSGVNTYLFGSANDSSARAMDIITNFHSGMDILDFTGLGTKFGSVVALGASASSIAGGGIAWQASGGNVFVYLNAGGNSQALTSATMKIELLGAVSLSNSNIVHL